MRWWQAVLGLALGATAVTARADGDEGHLGGDGVVRNGNVYLFDLVEAGVEGAPLVDESAAAAPGFAALAAAVDERLASLGAPEASRLVALKLAEISRKNEAFALALRDTLRAYHWSLVDAPLAAIDDGDSVLDPGALEMVQLAARYNRAVRIDEALWTRLSESHRAALVVHEIAYALIRPLRNANDAGFQSSQQARLVTGYLFTRDFAEDDGSFLAELIRDGYPSGAFAWDFGNGRFATAKRYVMKHVPLQSVFEDGRGHVFTKNGPPVDAAAEAAYLCARIRPWQELNPGNDHVALTVTYDGFDLAFDSYTNAAGVRLSYMRWLPAAAARDAILNGDVPRTAACDAATMRDVVAYETDHG